ncbi:MAG: hypothetical protein R2712_20775 [Vicinamibacterales bacterium]
MTPATAAFFIGVAGVMGATVMLLTRLSTRQQQEEDAHFRREAQDRGWTFQTDREAAFRIRRWTGVTDGIRWTAESWRAPSRRRNRARFEQRMRWWADTLRGPAKPVLFMGVPAGAETPSFTVADGEGLLSRLAQKAAGLAFDAAVDRYFGREDGALVDAGALRKVEGMAPPGYIVMAGDPSEGTRILFAGMNHAMIAARGDLAPADPEDALAWVLLLPRRVSIARMEAIRTTAELERVARAGAALVKRT